MRQCLALAGLLCLLASGCARTKLMGCGDGCRGDGCRVAMHRNAPRPLITRDACRPAGCLLDKDTGNCELAGCDLGCAEGCSTEGCTCDGCACGGPCQRLAERVAGGFCACGACGSCGMCPHRGGYPEYPAFNPGPPVGQVAYPYYTTRGPRDFLLDKPASIGPY